MAGRANVAGALQAGSIYRENWYGRHTAPGVIKAQYDAQAAQIIGETGAKVGSMITNFAVWMEGADQREANLENAKQMNQKLKLENQKNEQAYLQDISAKKQEFDTFKRQNPGLVPPELTYEQHYANQVANARSIANSIAGVNQSPSKTLGKSHPPINIPGANPNIQNQQASKQEGTTTIDVQSNLPKKAASSGPSYEYNYSIPDPLTIKKSIEDNQKFTQNWQKGSQQFYNNNYGKNIDQDLNPVEYGIFQSMYQNKDNPNFKPDIAYSEELGKQVAVFRYADGIGEDNKPIVKESVIALDELGNDGKWGTPVQIPKLIGNIVLEDAKSLPSVISDVANADQKVLGSAAMAELEQLYNVKKDTPGWQESFNKRLKRVSGGQFDKLYDANEDNKIDGKDFAKIASGYINQGRKTTEEIARQKGKEKAIESNAKRLGELDTTLDIKRKEATVDRELKLESLRQELGIRDASAAKRRAEMTKEEKAKFDAKEKANKRKNDELKVLKKIKEIKDAEKKKAAINTKIEAKTNEITNAITGENPDKKLISRVLDIPTELITWDKDNDDKITGFTVDKYVDEKRPALGKIEVAKYSADNPNDIKDLYNEFLEGDKDLKKELSPFVSQYFDQKSQEKKFETKIDDTLSTIDDKETLNNQTNKFEDVKGTAISEIKDNYTVDKVYKLDPRIKDKLVDREYTRGNIKKTKKDILTMFEIPLSKITKDNKFINLKDWPIEYRNALGPKLQAEYFLWKDGL